MKIDYDLQQILRIANSNMIQQLATFYLNIFSYMYKLKNKNSVSQQQVVYTSTVK